MKTLTMIVILVASALAAFARLGESNVQIKQRYGAVVSRTESGTNEWEAAYLFKEYKIMVIYYTNTCVAEVVTPIESRKFSDDERDALMKSIGGEGKWLKDSSSGFMNESWLNMDSKARAQVEDKFISGSQLTVVSPIFIDRASAEAKKKEKEKAEGF
jgi:hypothetical protein